MFQTFWDKTIWTLDLLIHRQRTGVLPALILCSGAYLISRNVSFYVMHQHETNSGISDLEGIFKAF
jgi:hypothetical protein